MDIFNSLFLCGSSRTLSWLWQCEWKNTWQGSRFYYLIHIGRFKSCFWFNGLFHILLYHQRAKAQPLVKCPCIINVLSMYFSMYYQCIFNVFCLLLFFDVFSMYLKTCIFNVFSMYYQCIFLFIKKIVKFNQCIFNVFSMYF